MSGNGYCQNCFELKLRVFVSPEKWNGVQSHLINTDNENFRLKEELTSEREKSAALLASGNYLDSAITGLLEDESMECGGDEDCDHCFANQASKEWHEALAKYRGTK